jgi:hypothetical protein
MKAAVELDIRVNRWSVACLTTLATWVVGFVASSHGPDLRIVLCSPEQW